MNSLTDLEFSILDELYFVSSFQSLIDNVNKEKELVEEALRKLLQNDLVIQVKMHAGREEKLDTPDFDTLQESYFVASKKGLLIHNSRN